MNAANELIEAMERSTGQRIEDNGFDNFAVAGLLGAMARELGQTPRSYGNEEDVAAGLLIQHRSATKRQRDPADEMLASMLIAGISPDVLGSLLGR